MQMQQEELAQAVTSINTAMRRASQSQPANTPPHGTASHRGEIIDPVWGSFGGDSDGQMGPCATVCVSTCPCCVPPYCSADRRAAWSYVASSHSCSLAILQIAGLVITLIPRGFAPTAVNGMLGPWPDTLSAFGAKNAAEIVYESGADGIRFVTSACLHAGIIHLATNLVLLLRVGLYLEKDWGYLRFMSIYWLSAVFATACSVVLLPDTVGVGASGALMGLLGGWMVHLIMFWEYGTLGERERRPI